MLIFEVELLSVNEGAPEAPSGAAQPPAPTPTPAPKADGSTPK
jgi:hypothetical protein